MGSQNSIREFGGLIGTKVFSPTRRIRIGGNSAQGGFTVRTFFVDTIHQGNYSKGGLCATNLKVRGVSNIRGQKIRWGENTKRVGIHPQILKMRAGASS